MSSYNHQTSNHLFFDRVRSIQFEIDLLRFYLESTGSDVSSEIDALRKCSIILFDDVYHSIRDKWV